MTNLSAWLQRQGVTGLDSADPWIDSMSLKSFATNDYLVHAGDTSDTLYLLQRVAQFHIASYLGIDAVSLSRLKRKHKE